MLDARSRERSRQESCGYARSKLLGLFSFLDISKSDAAILHGAVSYVDHHGNEHVHVDDFGRQFCPASIDVLRVLWRQYTWKKSKRAYKAGVVHIDEDELDADAAAGLEAEKVLQGKAKERHDREIGERNQKQQQERNSPSYMQFLCFLLFFMTTTDKTLPRWLYWLWFHIPSKKPSKEGLLKMTSDIWPKNHKYREKYSLAVLLGVKVVDAGFDAATFAIYNSKCGGAFARPALELKNEIFKLLAGEGLWRRVGEAMSKSLSDVSASMFRLEDRKLKGLPALYASKGDRKQTRREIRRFLGMHFHFTTMKTNEETLETKPGFLLPLLRNVYAATAATFAASSKAALGSSSKTDFVRNIQLSRKLAAWHAKRKQGEGEEEEEEEEAGVGEGGKEPQSLAKRAGQATQKQHHVPLEWKYRKQVQWPQERLQKRADDARDATLSLLRRVTAEVVPAKNILSTGWQHIAEDVEGEDVDED